MMLCSVFVFFFFFFNDTATTEIYTLSLHDALPICGARVIGLADKRDAGAAHADDRVHDADRDPGLLEPRPLLDVELDVRRDRAGGGLGLGDSARVEAGPRHRVDGPVAVDRWHRLDPPAATPS